MKLTSMLVLFLIVGLTSYAYSQQSSVRVAQAKSGAAATESPVKETKKTIGDWVVACAQKEGGVKTCALSQTLMARETHQFLSSISIGRDGTGKATGNITAPLGFAVNRGGQLLIGDTPPINIEFVTCLQNGCLSIVAFSVDQISDMQAASKLRVTLESLQKKPVNIDFSMKGFPKALAAYVDEVKN